MGIVEPLPDPDPTSPKAEQGTNIALALMGARVEKDREQILGILVDLHAQEDAELTQYVTLSLLSLAHSLFGVLSDREGGDTKAAYEMLYPLLVQGGHTFW